MTTSHAATAIRVDVGENDQNSKNAGGMNVYDAAKFKMVYGDFLTTLRTNYPNAWIYCGSHGDLTTDIQAIVTAKADANLAAFRAEVLQAGGTIVKDLGPIGALVVAGPANLKSRLEFKPFTDEVAADQIVQIVDPRMLGEFGNSAQVSIPVAMS